MPTDPRAHAIFSDQCVTELRRVDAAPLGDARAQCKEKRWDGAQMRVEATMLDALGERDDVDAERLQKAGDHGTVGRRTIDFKRPTAQERDRIAKTKFVALGVTAEIVMIFRISTRLSLVTGPRSLLSRSACAASRDPGWLLRIPVRSGGL
jgi:hypothetical protein